MRESGGQYLQFKYKKNLNFVIRLLHALHDFFRRLCLNYR